MSFQIQNLQTSIDSLQKKMQSKQEYYSSPLNLIFLASAPISINKLDPLKLTDLPLALDMYILKDQSLVLTSTWVEDILITLDFNVCQTKIEERFSQKISVIQQPFDQALVIKNKVFMFVNMDSDENFYGKKTPDLQRIYTILQHIISQEKSFLTQLANFNEMLKKADIFPAHIPKRKRSVPRINLGATSPKLVSFPRFNLDTNSPKFLPSSRFNLDTNNPTFNPLSATFYPIPSSLFPNMDESMT